MGNTIVNTTNISSQRETLVQGDVYYVKRDKNDGWKGWIQVAIEGMSKNPSICEYTRVVYLKTENSRVYYRIVDDAFEYGEQVASNREEAFRQYFKKENPIIHDVVLTIKYTSLSRELSNIRRDTILQEWGELTINGEIIRVTLNSSSEYTPIPAGTHKILRPDRSHANVDTEFYRITNPSKIYGNDVWFPIDIEGEGLFKGRYIHIGHISEGCVTVYDVDKWGEIYDYLIKRKKDTKRSKYIGKIVVEPYRKHDRRNFRG